VGGKNFESPTRPFCFAILFTFILDHMAFPDRKQDLKLFHSRRRKTNPGKNSHAGRHGVSQGFDPVQWRHLQSHQKR
jgi:hypothetical protein